MATNMRDLCRLCAKKDGFLKDLLDENNKNILKLLQDFIQIVVYENDVLPTKICMNCEVKMQSIELFIMECFKAQDTLKKMHEGNVDDIKLECPQAPIEFNIQIKSEVKDEVSAEDIVCALNNDASLSMIDIFPDRQSADDEVDMHNDDDDDYLDDIAIASLKPVKRHRKKRKEMTEKETEEFNNVLKKPCLKVKDFVKLQCELCGEKSKTWSGLRIHFLNEHNHEPYVYCLCGFAVKSKSVLYKHVSDHKIESRKLRKNSDETDDEEGKKNLKYDSLNVKDFIRFLCSHCEQEFASWYRLKEHSEVAHKVSPIVTCICGITLKSKSVMYKHVQDHRNPNLLSCDKCPRVTKTLAALNKHKMRHIPKSERKFCCASCEKIFYSKEALKSHERSHIPIEERKIYRCDICNMKFTTRSSAASHKRVVHDKIKGYVCDLCGYACGTNGELRQHRAIHSDDKPFVCRKCSKSFKTYSNLKTHLDTHEDTSYECYICRRVLNSRRTLRKHLLVHEDKCRHVCSYCNKAFKRRQTLKVHMYTHTGDKPLSCKWCDERFSYASTLRSHRLRCHPDKMAPLPTHETYSAYGQLSMQENYIKDVPPVNVPVPKNEVEAM